MKQARRKELKTNELSVYLQQCYDMAARNSSYIIGGVVIVVLVLIVGLMVRRNRLAAEQDAWRAYYNIREQSSTVTPELVDQARLLAAEHGSERQLGPRVLQLKGDLVYASAMVLSPNREQQRRLELFNEAKATYEQEIDQFGSKPDIVAKARMSLAAVEESLAIAGQVDGSAARTLYQEVVDSGPNAFQAEAEEKLNSLEERLAKLPIVASRPAEETLPTASAPALPSQYLSPATAPVAPTTLPTTQP